MLKRGLIPFDAFRPVRSRALSLTRPRPPDLLAFLAPDVPRSPLERLRFRAPRGRCVTAAALFGGHARVGFENNFTLPAASAPPNAELVAAAARALGGVGFAAQTAEGLRGGDRGGDGAVKWRRAPGGEFQAERDIDGVQPQFRSSAASTNCFPANFAAIVHCCRDGSSFGAIEIRAGSVAFAPGCEAPLRPLAFRTDSLI